MNNRIDLIEIYDRIEAFEKKKEPKYEMNVQIWKPIEVEEYSLPPFIIPEVRSRECTKRALSKTLAFIDSVKHKRLDHGCTIMPISCSNEQLLSICGYNHQSVSNLIRFMNNIGLLSVEDSTYQFNAYYDRHNHSKTYRYYYENEQKIKHYCELNKINRYEKVNDNDNRTIVQKFKVDTFENSGVRFSSKLELLKPDNMSINKMQYEHIPKCLKENYPWLQYYMDLSEEINEKYYTDYDDPTDPNHLEDLQIHFKPNCKWNKGNKAITKIGIRATNKYVSAKTDEAEINEDFNGYKKSDILEMYGLNLEKDVSSSVPRITLSLNKGKWIKEEEDIYEIIWNQLRKDNNRTIVQKFEEIRPAIKKLHMRGYFDKDTKIAHHTCRAMGVYSEPISKKEKDEIREEVRSVMHDYRTAIIEAEGGKLYDSEIFLHESCIYMDVLNKLLQEGYFVWQVYDAFYAKKEGVTQEFYEKHVSELVEECANNYINNYIVSSI